MPSLFFINKTKEAMTLNLFLLSIMMWITVNLVDNCVCMVEYTQ